MHQTDSSHPHITSKAAKSRLYKNSTGASKKELMKMNMTEPTEKNSSFSSDRQEHSTIESIRKRFLSMGEDENYIIQIPFAEEETEDGKKE